MQRALKSRLQVRIVFPLLKKKTFIPNSKMNVDLLSLFCCACTLAARAVGGD